MSKPAFEFRENRSCAGIPAQVIGDRLLAIGKRLKVKTKSDFETIPASAVVDDARPDESPLHPAFEWDDETAAERYREEEARRLIRSVKTIERAKDDEQDDTIQTARMFEPDDTPAFVSIGGRESCYVFTKIAMANPDMRDQVLSDALSALMGWRKRYAGLAVVARELAPVIAAIDEAVNVPA